MKQFPQVFRWPLEKEKAIHSSILAYKIPWTVHGVAKSRTWLSDFHFHFEGLTSYQLFFWMSRKMMISFLLVAGRFLFPAGSFYYVLLSLIFKVLKFFYTELRCVSSPSENFVSLFISGNFPCNIFLLTSPSPFPVYITKFYLVFTLGIKALPAIYFSLSHFNTPGFC